LVVEGTKQNRDFSRVKGGKQSHQIFNMQGKGGIVMVEGFENPLSNTLGVLKVLQN
jgi:hypothetical protein